MAASICRFSSICSMSARSEAKNCIRVKNFKHPVSYFLFFLFSTLNCGAKVCGLGSIESRTSSIKSFGFDESPCNPFWMSQNDFYRSNNFQKSLNVSMISINPFIFVNTCWKTDLYWQISNFSSGEFFLPPCFFSHIIELIKRSKNFQITYPPKSL